MNVIIKAPSTKVSDLSYSAADLDGQVPAQEVSKILNG